MTWQDKAKDLPEKPGVYLMRDAAGEVIYVGKAGSLRQRVRSYCHSTAGQPPKVLALVRNVADLEYIVTETAIEALVLECNLIKSYRPRYNINLRDDKAYPYLKVTVNEEIPRLVVTRRRRNDRARYFGPYTNAGALKHTLSVIRRVFPVRTCRRDRWAPGHRPCLNAHMGICLAPCSGKVAPAEYRRVVDDLVALLEGKGNDLVKSLRRRMEEAAAALRFEEAGRLRDQWQALEQVVAHQKVAFGGQGDHDVVGLAVSAGEAGVQVFLVRQSVVVGRENYFLEVDGSSQEEILHAFLQQFYSNRQEIPGAILLPALPQDAGLLAQWLAALRGKRVRLLAPRRGRKRELVARATANAAASLELRQRAQERQAARLAQLQAALGLARLPRRIEGYDISHLRGEATVGSMVVFTDGRPRKDAYRRFRLQAAGKGDDCASLQEVLRRRLRRGAQGDAGFASLPDLVLIDGGRGQAQAAWQVMAQFGLQEIPVYGLAKEEELLFPAAGGETLRLGRDTPALQLLQEVRDEAHRFAVDYHHRLRARESRRSVLDDIPGVGPKRRRALLAAFGSLEAVRSADVETIAGVEGMNRQVAASVKEYLQRRDGA